MSAPSDGPQDRSPVPDEPPSRGPVDDARTILSAEDMARALVRIGHEILERNKGADDVVLLGVLTRGEPLARRLAQVVADVEDGVDADAVVGVLDVTMHRDDLADQPTRALGTTELPRDGIDQKVVVLVDDVLYSGRTIRAALDALNDLGRPRAVQLAVLVDRGHRQLPIRADYVGKNLPTAADERVRVLLAETDGRDAVLLDSVAGNGPSSTSPASTGRKP